MIASAAGRGWTLALCFASFQVVGCSAVLGYESSYEQSRGEGGGVAGTGGADGRGGAGASAQGGGVVGGSAGATSGAGGQTGGASAQSGSGGAGQGGTAGAGQGGTAGAGQGGTAGLGQGGAAGAGQGGVPGEGGAAGAGEGGAGGQAGFLSGGSAGAGQGGAAGASGRTGDGGASGGGGLSAGTGGTGGSGGIGGAEGLPACVVSSAPVVNCGDLLASRDNCGACGLSCGVQGQCVNGRCLLEPLSKAPYQREVGFFGLPLAAQSTDGSDRLLYRVSVTSSLDGAVQGLFDVSTSDDAPLLKRLGTDAIKVGGVLRRVVAWKSARFVPNTTQVIAVASVARIPDEYPQDRVLVSLDRTTGNVLETFQLAGDDSAWSDIRPPVGGMQGALQTQDAVAIGALGQKRGVVWDFIAGTTGGAVLRGFPIPLTANGVFDTVIEPRYAIAGAVVAESGFAYFLSQATANAPFKLKKLKLEAGAIETAFGDANQSFVHPTAMVSAPNALFVLDAGGDPIQTESPSGTLYRYDLSANCTKSSPQPAVVAQDMARPIAVAADATYVYTLEVRLESTGTAGENVLTRRFHDGTGETVLLVEPRPLSFSLADTAVERAERLPKGIVLGKSYGKPLVFFGLGADPAEYRGPYESILGLPR